jgi:putative tricarboxylic transport membrane protein
MKKDDLISSAVLILVSIVYVIEARKLPMSDGLSPGPGFIPFWIGLSMALLSVSLFLKSLKTKPKKGGSTVFPKKGQGLKDIGYITLSLFAYLGLIHLFGFRISTFLFLAFLFKSVGRYGYGFSCSLSLLSTAALYGIFEYWLGMPFPTGRIDPF